MERANGHDIFARPQQFSSVAVYHGDPYLNQPAAVGPAERV
jgi:hypothetical protein